MNSVARFDERNAIIPWHCRIGLHAWPRWGRTEEMRTSKTQFIVAGYTRTITEHFSKVQSRRCLDCGKKQARRAKL